MLETYKARALGEGAAINADGGAQDTDNARLPHQAGTSVADGTEIFSQAFWDERYGSRSQLWSGNPNPHLITQIAELKAGRALDVGCGEGADAIWLAQRGWQVTAVDVSTVALARGARHAAKAGVDVMGRIVWRHENVLTWGPEPESFDLISSQFMQMPPELRVSLFRRLADGVAPGGTLLIVGHHPLDLRTTVRQGAMPDLLFTASEIAGLLRAEQWEILVEAAPERSVTDSAGEIVTIHDALLRARRRP